MCNMRQKAEIVWGSKGWKNNQAKKIRKGPHTVKGALGIGISR